MKSALAIAFFASLLAALPAAAGNSSPKAAQSTLDGDATYKANCMRCHTAIHTYSSRSMRTMINHMRVKANLTKDEADAIFRYLSGEDQQSKVAATNSAKGAVTQ
jgi:mono/diheme cytochrome c family protein